MNISVLISSLGPKRVIVSYCHTNASDMCFALCIVLCSSVIENNLFNIFYKTTRPTVLKFHMEHDLTLGSQNCKIRSGQISKMAAVLFQNQYIWLNFGMEQQWSTGIQNCKK